MIITYNEEKNISKCISSCMGVSDDIVIIDSNSRDRTKEYAEKLGGKVHLKNWEGYGAAKNYGASQAKYKWILSLDADEELDKDARIHLSKIVLNEENIYSFKRLNFLGEKLIKYGEWNPDIKLRLYDKSKATWNSSKVHERLIYNKDLIVVSRLEGNILHHSYDNLDDLQAKLDHYAKLSAEDIKSKAHSFLRLNQYLKPIARFIKSYIFKGGFLDGTIGLQIALLNAKAVFNRYKYFFNMKKKQSF